MEPLKILIIEQDSSTQTLYQNGLKDEEFEKRMVGTGQDALSAYEALRPEIVLLDIGLSDTDGISLLRKIRTEIEDDSATIIVATSLAGRENVMECIKIGIHGFIVKPVDSKTIAERILQYHEKRVGKHSTINPDMLAEMAKYNWTSLEKLEKSVQRIPINVGIEVLMQIDGVEAKLKSFVTGVHHGRYILVQCPKIIGIDTKLYPSNTVKMVYLYEGNVCTFKSRVLNYIKNPEKLIFVSYPDVADIHELRRNQRVDCLVQASIRCGSKGTSCKGMVVDISVKGCRFVSSSAYPNPLNLGERVELSLEFTGAKDTVSFLGEVRNVTQDSHRVSVGIEFAQSNSEAIQTVDNYINTIMSIF